MQLIETNVHGSDDTTTVEFVGEGGEKVSVCMAAHNMAQDAAITLAKEIMVQLTAFDPGPEQPGGFSSLGDFESVSGTRAKT